MHKLQATKLSTKKATTIDPPPSLPPPKYKKHQTPPPPHNKTTHTKNPNNNTQKQHTHTQTNKPHTHTWKSLFTRFVTLNCNIPAVICLTTLRVTILDYDYALSTCTWSVYQQQTVHQQTRLGLFISNRQYISKLGLVCLSATDSTSANSAWLQREEGEKTRDWHWRHSMKILNRCCDPDLDWT